MSVILSTTYLGPVSYYCQLYANRHILIERHEHYIKQTYRNRCLIAAPEGLQALTIPIVRQDPSHSEIKGILISDHGNWQHLHWQALITAYATSPYFEFYADDFLPFYEKNRWKYLFDFNEALRETVCQLIDLQPNIEYTQSYQTNYKEKDLRNLISPKQRNSSPNFTPKRYYQVFEQHNGFLPDLSIVDLLFNMGPESLVVMRDSISDFMNEQSS